MATPTPQRPIRDTVTNMADTFASAFVRGWQTGSIVGRHRRNLRDEELGARTARDTGNPLTRFPVPAVFQRAQRSLDFALLGMEIRRLKKKGAKILKKGGHVRVPVPKTLATPAQIDEQLRRARDRDRARGHTVPPEVIRGEKTQQQKAPRAPQTYEGDVIQRPRARVLDVPGIRARVGAPFGGGAVLSAGNELVSIYANLWYGQRERRERRRELLAVGRRGAAATRSVSSAVPGRTGAGSTRAPAIPGIAGPVPGSAPVVARSGAGTGTDTGRASSPAEGLPGRRTGGLATRERTTTGHARADVDLVKMATNALSGQLEQFLSPRALPRAIPGNRVELARLLQPIQGAAPLVTASTAPQSATSTQTATRSQDKPCECPKKQKTKKVHKCSNPVVSRYVKDGIIIIKRKLQCQPSKRKER